MGSSREYHGLQIMTACMQFIGVSLLSFCLSRRVPTGWRQWRHLTWGRTCVLLVLVDSWLFVFFTGLLSSGIGLSWSHTSCTLAIYSCISFYVISKILIYAFLSEKVYIVWTGGNQASRYKTKVYRLCAFVLSGYFAIGILMILGNENTVRADGVCVIGLKSYSTIPLIAYDLSLNIFLTAMFMCPLWVLHPMSPRLRSVAKRTLYGATISLISSAVNILIMLLLSGSELGWICITSCVSDVVINSFAVFCVSSGTYSSGTIRDRFSLPTMDMSALTFAATESSRPTAGSSTIPETCYDYLPPEHRKIIDPEKSSPLQKNLSSPTLETLTHSALNVSTSQYGIVWLLFTQIIRFSTDLASRSKCIQCRSIFNDL
ncbi:hypothetical protein F5050DRAFT_1780632 [Lentinula boryana]|uniref:Transmembrane protein n=1 Tax=Lentinula boryana TaxID=40481 RepID=A0ABQ8Q4I8_9AGAR|nr:hypothetical protein F5050DRAFT_1780632 [Lentinula boryana]